jgi:hypothetical protein
MEVNKYKEIEYYLSDKLGVSVYGFIIKNNTFHWVTKDSDGDVYIYHQYSPDSCNFIITNVFQGAFDISIDHEWISEITHMVNMGVIHDYCRTEIIEEEHNDVMCWTKDALEYFEMDCESIKSYLDNLAMEESKEIHSSIVELQESLRELNISSSLMLFDPIEGTHTPYPSEPNQYRKYHGKVAWMYNPYTGRKRDARDIGSDVFGYLIKENE